MTFNRKLKIPAFGFLRAEPLGEGVVEYTARWRLPGSLSGAGLGRHDDGYVARGRLSPK